jgi:Mor family transcriptional regulator
MSTEEIALYRRDKDFRRNEAIFVLNHVDLMPVEELAKEWNLSVEEIKKIIARHTEYWEATETTA